MKLDCNAWVGPWPFHKIREKDFNSLIQKHGRYGIGGGFVSSTEAIFYNDPLEADIDLAKVLADRRDYRQVITVNPMLPGAISSIRRARGMMDMAGIRILPGFHSYALHTPEVEALCEVLASEGLPLFLTLRMEDIRVEYMFQSKPVPIWELEGFLERHTAFPILLCNARSFELTGLRHVLNHQKNVFCDISGFKELTFCMEQLYRDGFWKWMVYGSAAPLNCMRSTLLLLEKTPASEKDKALVWEAKNFLNAVDPRYHPSSV